MAQFFYPSRPLPCRNQLPPPPYTQTLLFGFIINQFTRISAMDALSRYRLTVTGKCAMGDAIRAFLGRQPRKKTALPPGALT
jgi:hypothetical protein